MLYKLYYITIIIYFFEYININSSNIYNLFLIKLNNIKINFIFITILLNTVQIWDYSFSKLLITIWGVSNFSKKNLIISNFYTGYTKIHPNLQYLSSFFFLYTNINEKKNYKINTYSTLISMLIAFILGSLWALFQSIWGYYWSNDSVEYILLLFCYLAFLKLHNYNLKKKTYILQIMFIITLLSLLRLNFLHTKHNFFSTISNLKFYVFFMYMVLTNRIYVFNKFKQYKLIIVNLLLICLMYVLFSNKLNFFYIKLIINYFLIYIIIRGFFFMNKLNKYKLIHMSVLIFISIYIYINLKYISIKTHVRVFSKENLNLFIHNKFNILFSKLTSNSNLIIKLNIINTKYYNIINSQQTVIKKIINYF